MTLTLRSENSLRPIVDMEINIHRDRNSYVEVRSFVAIAPLFDHVFSFISSLNQIVENEDYLGKHLDEFIHDFDDIQQYRGLWWETLLMQVESQSIEDQYRYAREQFTSRLKIIADRYDLHFSTH